MPVSLGEMNEESVARYPAALAVASSIDARTALTAPSSSGRAILPLPSSQAKAASSVLAQTLDSQDP
jgi:hypothetical protein